MFACAPAFAQTTQDSAQPDTSAEQQEEDAGIVVTGSLLARSGFDSPTPVTSIGAEDLARVGAPDIAQVINQMPSVRPSFTPTSTANGGPQGGNYIDLRGLGHQRTLVLVDGRRYAPSTTGGGTNVSGIPQALIRGADIVTGGASATYGSDAVAGVVNFLIDDRFEGLRGKVQGGITDYQDYENYLASVAYGTSFADGRIRLVLAAEAASNKGIDFLGDRAWGRNTAVIANPASTNTNSEPRNLLVYDARYSNVSDWGVINSPNALRGIQFTADGTPIPYRYGTLVSSTTMRGGDGSDRNAENVHTPPSDRYTAFGRFTFDVSDALTLVAEAGYSKISSDYLSIPLRDQLTIRVDNPFIPTSIRDVMIAQGIPSFVMGRNAVDYARVMNNRDIETVQAVFGAKGDLGGSWKWNAYYSYGSTDAISLGLNSRINANFALAIDAVTHPTTGAAVCRSTLTNPTNGCVPINLIGGDQVSDAARNYINGVSTTRMLLKQHVVAGTVQGEPFSTWAGPVALAVGAEYRTTRGAVLSDPISAAQGFQAGGTIPYAGEIRVTEAFGEILVPLAKGQSWAQDLSLNLAGRVTDYSTSGVVMTWKAGLNYAINDSIRLRATRSRDIRAPAISELYAMGSISRLYVQDPQFNLENYQVQAGNSGNPDLVPEEADTFTAGIVLTPSVAPRLSLSVDYYDIRLNDAIISLTPATIVDQCYRTSPQLCSLIQRGPDNRITLVRNGPANIQTVRMRGIDFEAAYRVPLGSANLDLRGLATYIAKAEMSDGVSTLELHDGVHQPTIDALGGNPRWRFNTSASYSTDAYRLSLGARYVGGGRINPDYTEKDLDVLRVNGRLYLDLSGEYSLIKRANNSVALYGSIQNLLDQDPPVTGVGSNSTTRALYDAIGRLYTLGIKFKF